MGISYSISFLFLISVCGSTSTAVFTSAWDPFLMAARTLAGCRFDSMYTNRDPISYGRPGRVAGSRHGTSYPNRLHPNGNDNRFRSRSGRIPRESAPVPLHSTNLAVLESSRFHYDGFSRSLKRAIRGGKTGGHEAFTAAPETVPRAGGL